jgi:hypothetical protein
MALQNSDLFVVERGGKRYQMAADQVTAKTGATGASILPAGPNTDRPASPNGGHLRWNTDPSSTIGNRVEVFDSAIPGWKPLAYAYPPPAKPDIVLSNGNISGVIYCRNFTVPAGVKVKVLGSYAVIATGDVVIDGEVNGDFEGPKGGVTYYTTVSYTAAFKVGSGEGQGGGNSYAGGAPYGPGVSPSGSGGDGGFGVHSYTSLSASSLTALLGDGGNAGASFLVRALGSITIGASGVIRCNGQDGTIADRTTANQASVTGPGGGSGGTIIFDADGDFTNNGWMSANAGNGGNGHNLAAGGGGGGGGGWIVGQSRYGTSSLGVTSVKGGAAGANGPPGDNGAGPYWNGGGGGGSNAGAGGNGLYRLTTGPLVQPAAGTDGFAYDFGSPF